MPTCIFIKIKYTAMQNQSLIPEPEYQAGYCSNRVGNSQLLWCKDISYIKVTTQGFYSFIFTFI